MGKSSRNGWCPIAMLDYRIFFFKVPGNKDSGPWQNELESQKWLNIAIFLQGTGWFSSGFKGHHISRQTRIIHLQSLGLWSAPGHRRHPPNDGFEEKASRFFAGEMKSGSPPSFFLVVLRISILWFRGEHLFQDTPSDQVLDFKATTSLRDAAQVTLRIPLAEAQNIVQVVTKVSQPSPSSPRAANDTPLDNSMFAPCFAGWNSDGTRLDGFHVHPKVDTDWVVHRVRRHIAFAIWVSPKSVLLPSGYLLHSHGQWPIYFRDFHGYVTVTTRWYPPKRHEKTGQFQCEKNHRIPTLRWFGEAMLLSRAFKVKVVRRTASNLSVFVLDAFKASKDVKPYQRTF